MHDAAQDQTIAAQNQTIAAMHANATAQARTNAKLAGQLAAEQEINRNQATTIAALVRTRAQCSAGARTHASVHPCVHGVGGNVAPHRARLRLRQPPGASATPTGGSGELAATKPLSHKPARPAERAVAAAHAHPQPISRMRARARR